MRSRYSAFVLGLGEYLVHSWHPDYLGDLTAELLSQTDTQWDGLEIIASQGGPDDTLGMVEFKAWFMEGEARHYLHERSRFVRHQGAGSTPTASRIRRRCGWDATTPAPAAAARSSRSAAAERRDSCRQRGPSGPLCCCWSVTTITICSLTPLILSVYEH
ncbi:YchJ family protein [Aeromonas hydrophila]